MTETMSKQESWQLADEAAVAYERDFVPAIMSQWPPVIAAIAGIGPGDRVLDVACGTGVLAREAATRVGPNGRVTGLDINDAMLVVARRLRPDIEWRQGDAMKLPFADSAFDVVASQMAFMFFPDQVAALHEMWRVLAPGGRLAVAVCAPIGRAEGYRRLAEILRRRVGDRAAAMVEGYFAHGDEGRLLRLAEAAGIGGAEALTRQGTARFASIDDCIRIEIKGSPLAELVVEAAYDAVVEDARQELREFCDAQRRLVMPLDAAILAARKIGGR